MKLTTHFNVVLSQRMCGAIPQSPTPLRHAKGQLSKLFNLNLNIMYVILLFPPAQSPLTGIFDNSSYDFHKQSSL